MDIEVLEPDHERTWHTESLEGPSDLTALSWYLDVAENRRPAKFRIAATIATELDPAESSEAALWAELDRVTPIFLARWGTIRAGASLPRPAEGTSLLELCRELAVKDQRYRRGNSVGQTAYMFPC